jgi:hypothetical protein
METPPRGALVSRTPQLYGYTQATARLHHPTPPLPSLLGVTRYRLLGRMKV